MKYMSIKIIFVEKRGGHTLLTLSEIFFYFMVAFKRSWSCKTIFEVQNKDNNVCVKIGPKYIKLMRMKTSP